MKIKAFIVYPPWRNPDWDLYDVVMLARHIGKGLFRGEGARVFKLQWDRDLSAYIAYAVATGDNLPLRPEDEVTPHACGKHRVVSNPLVVNGNQKEKI